MTIKACLEDKVSNDCRLCSVRKLYPLLHKSGHPQRAEACTINAWKGSAASTSNLSGLWGAIFYVQWAWVGRWVGDDAQTGGGDLPKDHSHQLMTVICPADCTCTGVWKEHSPLQKRFTGLFPSVSYHAYTHIDAEMTFPVCFFSCACPCPFTTSPERAPAYVTNPLTQSVYGSTQITCNV